MSLDTTTSAVASVGSADQPHRFDERPLAGQSVVVLGGSSGIGLASAATLVARGATVVIGARDAGRLESAARTIMAPEGLLTTDRVDAAHRNSLAAFFGRIGTFDHLVLTLSGAAGAGSIRVLDLHELRAGFEAKFWAHLNAVQAALDTLRATGSITFVTAISARTALPNTAGLAAINGALEAMVRPLASELRPLRVNAVSPGVIDTRWWSSLAPDDRAAMFARYSAATPAGRIGTAADVSAAVALLVENTFMTGTVLEVDGGLRFGRATSVDREWAAGS
jgi:NAD(P)-dependent dehydrogenase (short-subunit alcohol dehydrogenase family)